MDFSLSMTTTDRSRVDAQTAAFNETLTGSPDAQEMLGRDDFLRILLTQLQNQDPTQPMEDKEFISQMAQFSSLEQMTNVATGFQQMNALLSSTQALSVLGRTVEIGAGDQLVVGTVSAIDRGAIPQITVNNQQYDLADVTRIME